MPAFEIDDLLKDVTQSNVFTEAETKLMKNLLADLQHIYGGTQTVLLFKASRENTLAIAKLTKTIDRFNEQSGKQTKKMICLTWVITGLTAILLLLAGTQIWIVINSPFA